MIDVYRLDQKTRQLRRDLADYERVRTVLAMHDAAGTTAAWTAIEPADLQRAPRGVDREGAGRRSTILLALAALATTAAPAVTQEVSEVFRDCDVCPEMVVVPAGSFLMGSPETEEGRRDNEGPQRRVTINYTFAVGIYEVTVDEWNACVRAGGCPEDGAWYDQLFGNGGRTPADVQWEQAWQYADWLSRTTGHVYRLPSEAEWEYVARAGTRTARYWGDSPITQCQYANGYDATAHSELDYDFFDMVGCRDAYGDEQAPVGSFRPNAWGLYDVLGNAEEWVDDCWNRQGYDGAPTDGSSWYTGECDLRVARGGDERGQPHKLRSAYRYLGILGLSHVGFRVARAVR